MAAEDRSMGLTIAECGVVELLVFVFSTYGKWTGRWPNWWLSGWRGTHPPGSWRTAVANLLARALAAVLSSARPLARLGQHLCRR